MAAYCQVYDSCHLQADCQEPSVGYLFCRAAAHILLTASYAAVDRYLLFVCAASANPQQQRVAAGWKRQTDMQLHKPCSANYGKHLLSFR